MSQFNFEFEGNLAADAEFGFTKTTGQPVCRLRVVHNRRRRNRDGQWEDGAPMFVTVTAWGDLAERCAELQKGNTVVVDARDVEPYAFQRQDGTFGALLQANAANVSLSMRFTGAKALPKPTPAAEDWSPTEPEAEPEPEREMELAA